MNILAVVIGVVLGFLAGSVPFALLLGLARGVDIRTVGSKNPGATNLGRALGFKWFLLCFAIDALKGAVPTALYGVLSGAARGRVFEIEPADSVGWLVVMASPVLGHMFSPWIGFKGGKGVATGLGALLGVYPLLTFPGLGALVIFCATLGVWRYVSLSSVLAAASLPVWTWYFFSTAARVLATPPAPGEAAEPLQTQPAPFLIVTLGLAAAVIWKHRGNLERLSQGTEPKVGRGPRT